MSKSYVIWWHSQFIDEINRESTTIAEIVDKVHKTLHHLKKLEALEEQKKIKMKATSSLNPIYIEILDKTIEPKVAANPLVEVAEIKQ